MSTNDCKAKKTAARAKPKSNSTAGAGARATSSGSVKAPKSSSTSSGAISAPKVSASAASAKKAPNAKASAKPEAAKPAPAKTPSSAGTVKAASSPGTVKAAAQIEAAKPKPEAAKLAKAPSSAGSEKAAAPIEAAKPTATIEAAKPAATIEAAKPAATIEAAKSATSNGAIKSPTSNGAAKAPIVEVTPVDDEPTLIEQVLTQPKPKSTEPAAAKAGSATSAQAARKPEPSKSVVDGWARTRLDESQRILLDRIRTIVKRVAPQATEAVKWAQPVWERNGPFAFLKPGKRHLTFGFWRGAELPDPRGLLEGAGKKMRHLKIALGEKPPLEAIAEFVREAVRRNEAAGDPTKRR